MAQIFYNCGLDAPAAAVKSAMSRTGSPLEHDRQRSGESDASDHFLKLEGHIDLPRALFGTKIDPSPDDFAIATKSGAGSVDTRQGALRGIAVNPLLRNSAGNFRS